MNNQTSQPRPASKAGEFKPLLMLRPDQSARPGKPSANLDAAFAGTAGRQALAGANGRFATVRFRARGARLNDSNP